MVVDHFHIIGVPSLKAKDDPQTGRYIDSVRTLAIASQLVQPGARRRRSLSEEARSKTSSRRSILCACCEGACFGLRWASFLAARVPVGQDCHAARSTRKGCSQ